jgi:hypothetical protein
VEILGEVGMYHPNVCVAWFRVWKLVLVLKLRMKMLEPVVFRYHVDQRYHPSLHESILTKAFPVDLVVLFAGSKGPSRCCSMREHILSTLGAHDVV